MAVHHVSREEIEQIRGSIQKNKVPAGKNPVVSDEKSFIDMISDEQIAKVFENFNYLGHKRMTDCIHVNCFDFEVFFNDFSLLSSKKSNNNLLFQFNQGIKPQTDFRYEDYERFCETMGITAEKAIYDYLYDNLFSKLPFYTEKKHEFDQKVADNVELGTRKSVYGNLLKPAIATVRENSGLRVTKKQFGSTNPEKIADVFSRVKG